MSSANDFAAAALKLLGVLDPTESPSSEDGETAFDTLNRWMDGLGTQRQTIYFLTRTTQTLSSGTASYTIGTGGTIAIARPVWIERATLITDTSATYPDEQEIAVLRDEQYEVWPQKTLQSTYANAIWYDHNWSSGLGRIYPLPIPNVSTTQLVLYTPTALTQFADQSTDYTFPPGYARAIVYNLAHELSAIPSYGGTAPKNLAGLAVSSLADLKRANTRYSTVRIDPTLTRPRGRPMTVGTFLGGNF